MGSVEVIPISLPRDTLRFIQPWFAIYANDPHWVPPLLLERKRFFDPRRNPYFNVADVQCFVARREGRDVGTIAAVVDHAYQRHERGTGFFGFFEFVDDLEVAAALLGAAREWQADRGMKKLVGPFNFNTNHDFALLVDGFDSDPTIANPHNSAYYPKRYEELGLRPVKDWYAYRVEVGLPGIAKMQRVAERMLARHPEMRIRSLDLSDFDAEVARLRAIYTDAWQHNWGHVEVGEAEFEFIAKGFRQIIDPELCFMAEVEGKPIAISVTLPDLNPVVKKMKGRLWPFGWYYFLTRARRVTRARVFMLGVATEYQSLPLGAVLYARTAEAAERKGYAEGEASLILEDNHRMRGALEKIGATIAKTYRNYEIEVQAGTGDARSDSDQSDFGSHSGA
ncbi:MAG: N-acetyltransferase [Deltaproteobacteria bacterium]|nr:N-acetyltransferase [Deltaproteobacteria bacterium]